MQFRPADVKDPAFKVARIIRNDGFIETADLLASGILHLGAVSTVLEYHNIVPLGFCDQMGLDETEETNAAASVNSISCTGD